MDKIALTDEYKNVLFRIPLFDELPFNIKTSLLDRLDYSVYHISKGEEILRQNTLCKSLYVLLHGKLRVDIIDVFGNKVMVETIRAARAFATPHLFSKENILPATFTVLEDGVFFTATKESVFKLISEEPSLLKSFLCVTGNCNSCTTARLRALSHRNVRNRIVSYFFEHLYEEDGTVHLEHTQGQLADYLCVTRPALSKEINKMVKEGLIAISGKSIQLVDLKTLQTYIR